MWVNANETRPKLPPLPRPLTKEKKVNGKEELLGHCVMHIHTVRCPCKCTTMVLVCVAQPPKLYCILVKAY